MKQTIKTALIGYAGFFVLAQGLAMANAQPSADMSYKDRAQAAIEKYQTELKAELTAAIKQGGPKAAIEICGEKAPQIAQKTGREFNLEIHRTSLKQRNRASAPDPWETATLEQFNIRRDEGAAPDTIEAIYKDDTIFRYIKAIPTQGICMTCHGEKIDPGLYREIKARYPDDLATGYKPGEIRGAFTVKISEKK